VPEENKTETDGFTERAIMSLMVEATELKETILRIVAVVGALAIAHDVSTEV
jgi:hypothetical protein